MFLKDAFGKDFFLSKRRKSDESGYMCCEFFCCCKMKRAFENDQRGLSGKIKK